ncbi:hypothetical protein D7V94_13580 [Parablautia intestinalis]|uniref:Uncharacterized protein n=1 Tax=Parablautia intestinalis TaxID=2320100 RepID=A0A3A9ATD2_9FIRM|nr:hypothetical protein [Parablautia intestinalis]RKI90456.1 hypothetical protein D7V94_13580 [Parablautia intestinalis]
MKRLTERDEFGNADIIGVDSMDLQCNLSGEEFNKITKVLNKLAEYEDLEEQGKLLKLPCKAGQRVYLLRKDIKTVIDGEITSIRIGEFAIEMKIFIIDDNRYTDASFDKIGDIIFFTREEAEAVLKEL